MNLLYHINKKQVYINTITATIILCLSFLYVGSIASAAVETDIEEGLRDKYKELCVAFNTINTNAAKKDKLAVNCNISELKKSGQDKKVRAICKKYGNNKLKSECSAYRNYEPGSGRQAQSGGEVAKSFNDPALDCTANADKCDLVKKYINPIIAFLSALVGVAVTIGLITGGIRYASAGDDPQKVNEAKKFISTSLMALFVFFILYAGLRWLMPSLT
jgi:hypothetical protein